ncbi:hypothetical protein [Streptomyces sp. cg35]|uniref:hypothetical protein n=1 Tax=Streptomyces sp. cg35 TaxID=3421650 RepID=UPI003D169DF0
MPQPLEPIIIEPHESDRLADPAKGEFLLYDKDFPPEEDPRFAVVTEGEPLCKPHFGLSETAAWVFGRKPDWLRRMTKGKPWRNQTADGYTPMQTTPLLLQGKPLIIRQVKGRGLGPQRRFTLADIERLAWALYETGSIDGAELQRASAILVAVARQYGFQDDHEQEQA